MADVRAEPRHAQGVAVRAVAAAVATGVLGAVLGWLGATYGVQGVGFAFAVNWIAMAWMGIVGRLYPPPLPESYFRIRHFERSGRLYVLLGVRVVKAVVRRGPLHWFNPHLRLRGEPTADRLLRLERRMREPEAAHLWLFVLMLPVVAYDAARGWWWAAAWTLLFDVVLNAYPVMLQRYNRRWLQDRAAALTLSGTRGSRCPRG